MHELSIALSILDLATEEARRHGDARILGIRLRLGPLAGVVKEALLFSYDVAKMGSPLEDAQLVIEDVPVAAYCPTCGGVRAVVSVQNLCCLACGTPTRQVVSGQELEVVGLEIQ